MKRRINSLAWFMLGLLIACAGTQYAKPNDPVEAYNQCEDKRLSCEADLDAALIALDDLNSACHN